MTKEQELRNNAGKLIIYLDTERPMTWTGTDRDGNRYREFMVDYLARELPLHCVYCDGESDHGFLCLDGGEEFCMDCVELED